MSNPIIHFEIGCRDLEKTQTFFGSLFDWNLQSAGMEAMIDTGTPVNGHISRLGHEPHNYTIFYVQVDDVPSCIDKAVALGGKSLVPPVSVPTGTFAWIADPEGNTIGLFKPRQ